MPVRFAILIMLGILLVACGGGAATPPPPRPTAAPTDTPTEEPIPVGDAERGRMIFNGEEVLTSSSCHDCHSLDGADRLNVVGVPLAPSLQGISGRAQQRVPGMSAEAYIRKSIVDPQSYVAEGYEGKMGSIWSMLLKDDDIDDLVAFLLTQ